MSRISELFGRKKERVLNVYCTAGYPQLDSTLQVIQALEAAGADLIELGMPYSDPLADGPVIQASSTRALANGMTIAVLFEQLKGLRKQTNIPVVLMGYMNPVLQYGFERFCEEAAALGVDGLILPDLPAYEYETLYGPVIKKYGLDLVFLVTPETSADRVLQLDALSSGFLYAVSSSATTGSDKDFGDVQAYLRRLKELQLKNPILVGFGVKDKDSFNAVCAMANGAIIGTAYIKALEGTADITTATSQFLAPIVQQ